MTELESRLQELLQQKEEARNAWSKAMGELNRASDALRALTKEIGSLCPQLPEGHDYQKQSHCISGHGHYWNCARCGYGAPGRHNYRPSGHLV